MRDWIESASVFLLAAAAAYLFIRVPDLVAGWSLMLPGTTERTLAPAFFPRVALAVLVVLCVWTGIAALRRAVAADSAGTFGGASSLRTTAAAFGWILSLMAYLVVMRLLGFYIASALMIFTLGYLAGYRRSALLVVIAIAAPMVVELVFLDVLNMVLPRGRYWDFSLKTALFG